MAMTGSVAYTYDMDGKLLAAVYGDGQRSVFTYDDSGNIISVNVVGEGLSTPAPMLLLLDDR